MLPQINTNLPAIPSNFACKNEMSTDPNLAGLEMMKMVNLAYSLLNLKSSVEIVARPT